MSNMYPKFKAAQLGASPTNLLTADVRALLIDSADETYNAADEFLADITAAGRIGAAVSLANKSLTVVGNTVVFDADNVTIPSVSGDPAEAVLLYVHTGVDATARLIALIDGLAFSPNGGDGVITWDDGANKIFSW